VTQLTRFMGLTFAFSLALLDHADPAYAKPYNGISAAQFMRNDNSSFHHFTIYQSEIDQINATDNWTRLEPDFYAFDRQLPGLVPLYRLQKGGDHFFTVDPQERLRAMSDYDYRDEQICCYISEGPAPGTVPLLRFLKGGIHFYQALLPGGSLARSEDGWKYEGTAGYVWPARGDKGVAVPPPIIEGP